MKMTPILTAGLISGAITFVSCTTNQQNYGLGGAAAGAAIGAITGGDPSDVLKAAAIGGASGAAYGYYKDSKQQNPQGTVAPPTPPAPPVAPPSIGRYPTAHRTDQADIVISPYRPYNKVRVKGFKPGELAKDPKTGEIFVIPD